MSGTHDSAREVIARAVIALPFETRWEVADAVLAEFQSAGYAVEAADTIARLRERVAELEGRAAVHGRRTRSMNREISRLSSDAAGGAGEIAAERRRQKEVEGWTPEHDDEHTDGSLAAAAAAYAFQASLPDQTRSKAFSGEDREGFISILGSIWPARWHWQWWKPTDRRRDLVKAGALVLAEIERLDRLAKAGEPREGEGT